MRRLNSIVVSCASSILSFCSILGHLAVVRICLLTIGGKQFGGYSGDHLFSTAFFPRMNESSFQIVFVTDQRLVLCCFFSFPSGSFFISFSLLEEKQCSTRSDKRQLIAISNTNISIDDRFLRFSSQATELTPESHIE